MFSTNVFDDDDVVEGMPRMGGRSVLLSPPVSHILGANESLIFSSRMSMRLIHVGILLIGKCGASYHNGKHCLLDNGGFLIPDMLMGRSLEVLLS